MEKERLLWLPGAGEREEQKETANYVFPFEVMKSVLELDSGHGQSCETTELYILKSSINTIFELQLNKNYGHPHFVIMGNFS